MSIQRPAAPSFGGYFKIIPPASYAKSDRKKDAYNSQVIALLQAHKLKQEASKNLDQFSFCQQRADDGKLVLKVIPDYAHTGHADLSVINRFNSSQRPKVSYEYSENPFLSAVERDRLEKNAENSQQLANLKSQVERLESKNQSLLERLLKIPQPIRQKHGAD